MFPSAPRRIPLYLSIDLVQIFLWQIFHICVNPNGSDKLFQALASKSLFTTIRVKLFLII
jgi:hypothetical protein